MNPRLDDERVFERTHALFREFAPNRDHERDAADRRVAAQRYDVRLVRRLRPAVRQSRIRPGSQVAISGTAMAKSMNAMSANKKGMFARSTTI